jgi:hypothetical protein
MRRNLAWRRQLWVVLVVAVVSALVPGVSAAPESASGVLWTDQFGTAGSEQSLLAAVSSDGSLYVGGTTSGSLEEVNSGSNDVFVRKYDASGTVLWSDQFGSASSESLTSVAVGLDGSLYVVGNTWGSVGGVNAGSTDGFVRKYGAFGTILWTEQFGSAGYEELNSVVVATDGSVYLAGHTTGALSGANAGGRDGFVRKYSDLGTVQWTDQFGTAEQDRVFSAAVGDDGSLHLAGSTGSGGTIGFVRKQTATGSVLWTRQFGGGGNDEPTSLAVGEDGTVYVVYHSTGCWADTREVAYHSHLLRIDSAGLVVWQTEQPERGTFEKFNSVSIEGGNTVVVAGTRYASAIDGAPCGGFPTTSGGDGFVQRRDSEGTLMWDLAFDSGAEDDLGAGAVGSDGAIYVGGNTSGSLWGVNAGDRDGFVARIDPTGPPTTTTTTTTTSPGDALPGDTNGDGIVRVAVVGDSFISGEGAYSYVHGTDDQGGGQEVSLNGVDMKGGNNCHQSTSSWAYELGLELTGGLSGLEFFACSGAVTRNLGRGTSGGHRQYVNEWTSQDSRLAAAHSASAFDIVFVSIGGNDAHFSALIQACLGPSQCREQDWTSQILPAASAVKESLERVKMLADGATVYAIGYPNPISTPRSGCTEVGVSLLAPLLLAGQPPAALLSQELGNISAVEQRWIGGAFVPQLNDAIERATLEAGVNFIDVETAFRNHGICDEASWVNGITAGEEIAGVVGNESFHPTATGHSILRDRVRAELVTTGRITENVNPSPIATGLSAFDDSLTVIVTGLGELKSWSGGGEIVIRNGPRGMTIVTTTFSVPVSGISGLTDADGDLELAWTVPEGLAPGIHVVEVRAAVGDLLTTFLFEVEAPPGCLGTPDLDGDNVRDSCDALPWDGPAADADSDGVLNGDDNCSTVSNPGQTDSNSDGRGDACDQSAGFNPANIGLSTNFELDSSELAGLDCPAGGDPFVDVASASFARGDVSCIFNLGITTGTSAMTYDPAGIVTREQMASFLARLWRAA